VKRRSRLFALAEYLRGRRTGVTAEELAERFGVTVRTIYRDLDALRDAALPVRADRGRGGGYALDKSYSLPPVNFTAREAAVLLAAGRYVTELRILPFADTLGAALDKVRGALSTSAQRELTDLVERLQLVGVPAPRVEPSVRRAVERAWFEGTPLALRYRRSDGVLTERTVRVTGLVMERSMTLVVCDDLGKGEPRQLRLDRIEAAAPGEQT
jgi:predicted DNA-binding transcriptional regulator YafY